MTQRFTTVAVMGPLDGVKVIELAAIGPVPWAGMMLGDLGAEVIRIDRMHAGPVEMMFPGDPTGRGRRSIALDLKKPEAIEIALRLVDRADILIEGFRPGVMERLGLGPSICLAHQPRLVYGRMSGWGQTGPRAGTAGHDINYLAISGTLSALGPREYPLPPLNLVADYGGGAMLLLVGILAALIRTREDGEGQVIDAAMVEGAALLTMIVRGAIASGNWLPERETNLLDGGAPFYRTYQTSDGGFVAVGALEPQFYASLLRGLEVDPGELPDQFDRTGWPVIKDRLATMFSARPREHWDVVFAGTDACVTPVLTMSESPRDPHLVHRSSFAAPGGITQPAPAPRFSQTPSGPPGPPPLVGADSRAILYQLGYGPDQIGMLLGSLVVGAPTTED